MSHGWGRVAYEAYAESCGGKSIHGETLPSWDDQKPEIRQHWEKTAFTVIQAYTGRLSESWQTMEGA